MCGGSQQTILIPPLDFDLYKQLLILLLTTHFERRAEIWPRLDLILNFNELQSLNDYDFPNL